MPTYYTDSALFNYEEVEWFKKEWMQEYNRKIQAEYTRRYDESIWFDIIGRPLAKAKQVELNRKACGIIK